MADGWNVWDIFSGVLGITPFILALLYHQLPSNKFRVLDEVLQETETLLSSSLESGLIPDSKFALQFTQSVEQLRDRAECVRPEVYCAKTCWQQVKGVGSGLTSKISVLSDSVLDLRAEITMTRSRERERLRQEADLTHPREAESTVTDGGLLTFLASLSRRCVSLIPGLSSASAGVPHRGPDTAVLRPSNLDSARISGFPGSEVVSVEVSAAGNVTTGTHPSDGAETAHPCCCGGHGQARRSYSPPPSPKVISRSPSSTSLPSEGEDAVYDRAQQPTTHPGPSASLDSLSLSDMPHHVICASIDAPVVHNGGHRRCR